MGTFSNFTVSQNLFCLQEHLVLGTSGPEMVSIRREASAIVLETIRIGFVMLTWI